MRSGTNEQQKKKKIPPLPTQSSPQRWQYAWEISKLFCKAINMREQSASIYFTKWPLSKVTNCPNNILAATAGGLIIRKHLLKMLASALRLFPYPCTTARPAEQYMPAEGAFPSAHFYHLLEQHKVTKILCCHTCSPSFWAGYAFIFLSTLWYVDRYCNMVQGYHAPAYHQRLASARQQWSYDLAAEIKCACTSKCNPLIWSIFSIKMKRDETGVLPTCSFTLKQIRKKSHHLLRGQWNCHWE